MEVKEDEVVNTIRWRLGIPVDANIARYDEIWKRLTSASDLSQLDRISRFLTDIMEQVVRYRLGLPISQPLSGDDKQFLDTLWASIAKWMDDDKIKRSPRVSGLIKDALSQRKGTAATPARPAGGSVPARPMRPTPPPPPVAVAPPPPPVAVPLQPEIPPMTDSSRNRPAAPQWLYKPVPEQEPNPHSEAEARALETPTGELLLAARVRGKKHKHEGSNCDDWFEIGASGTWTLIAVADGAGSRRLSRLGARVSCTKALELLTLELANVSIKDSPSAEVLLARDDGSMAFLGLEVATVQQALVRAVMGAHFAVESEAGKLQASQPHQRLLGRPVAFEDLSATLLLAAHTTLSVAGQPHSLVVACQIGDGAVGVLDGQANVHVLGLPDSGDYSGETDFLTSRRQVELDNLRRKTFAYAGPVRALMVMTDGVADDYFPADPGLARLYADLVLNQILPPGPAGAEGAAPGIAPVRTLSFDPTDGRLDGDAEIATKDGPVTYKLRSAALFASELGVSPGQLAAAPDWLRAGACNAPLLALAAAPQDRLKLWLDAYQVRGSFDDRTLVVLHRGRVS
jgi:hypothetical protein